jgi:hypothetical protein
MSSAEALSGGSGGPDPIVSYLLKLTRDDGAAPQSTIRTFVEPRVRANADGTTSGVLEILRAERRLLLFGGPGAGKSTAIRVLVHQMARAYLDSKPADCPVLIAASGFRPLGDVPWALGGDPWGWLSSAAMSLAGAGIRPVRALKTALITGRAHIFVDGLDEIPDARQRSRVADALDYMQRESPGLKICVSARPAGTSTEGPLGRFAAWTILPFDGAEARQLLALLTGSRESEIRRQVAAAPRLGSLVGSPLMLRLLSLYADQHGLELPRSRLQLFEDLADAMLAREQQAAPRQISIRALHRGHEIAAESITTKGTSALPVSELAAALARDPDGTFTEGDADLFLRIAQERVAILTQTSPGEVGFSYRAFQDFYLGRSLARDITVIGGLVHYDLSEALSFAVGLAVDAAPVIRAVYERFGVARAARCCNNLRQGHEVGRRYLAKIVLDDLGADFHKAILEILREGSGSLGEAAQLPEEAPFAGLRQAWEAMPRKGAPGDIRGRGLEQFAVAFLGTYFEVVAVRPRRQAGEVDVICENLNSDPFWANYPGDIWVECKNTEEKATLEQVNTFLGKLMASRGNLGFFLSTAGFTKDAMNRLKTVASDRTIPLIAPVAGDDIAELLEQHTDPARFFKSVIRKVA